MIDCTDMNIVFDYCSRRMWRRLGTLWRILLLLWYQWSTGRQLGCSQTEMHRPSVCHGWHTVCWREPIFVWPL